MQGRHGRGEGATALALQLPQRAGACDEAKAGEEGGQLSAAAVWARWQHQPQEAAGHPKEQSPRRLICPLCVVLTADVVENSLCVLETRGGGGGGGGGSSLRGGDLALLYLCLGGSRISRGVEHGEELLHEDAADAAFSKISALVCVIYIRTVHKYFGECMPFA